LRNDLPSDFARIEEGNVPVPTVIPAESDNRIWLFDRAPAAIQQFDLIERAPLPTE
jgi:hypothetical protein